MPRRRTHPSPHAPMKGTHPSLQAPHAATAHAAAVPTPASAPTHAPAVLPAAPPGGHERLWLALAAVAALVALAVLVVYLVRRRRRRRGARGIRREPRPKYPIVLAHGLLTFDAVSASLARRQYFKKIADRLERAGYEVYRPAVAGAASVQVRAQALADFIHSVQAPRVNVVAHSMGGIDARYAIAKLGIASRVASLTTVGTPHQGTPLADLSDKLGVVSALRKVGLKAEALVELTSVAMEEFNRAIRDARGVTYASVVAKAVRARHVNPILVPSYLYLRETVGDNDGMVPAESQKWGDVVTEIEADHWAQIGWSRHFDAAEFYESLLRELRGRGF